MSAPRLVPTVAATMPWGAELEQFKLLLVYEFKLKTFYVQSLPRSGLAKPLHCTSGECNGDYKDGGMSVHGYVYSEKRV